MFNTLPATNEHGRLLKKKKKKKKKNYAGLVEQLQEGHGPSAIPARVS
jgi:hypothetical protein